MRDIEKKHYTWPKIVVEPTDNNVKISKIDIIGNNLQINYSTPQSKACKSFNYNSYKADILKAWQRANDIPKGLKVIAYACGSDTCGAYGLKGTKADVKLINGLTEIIVPWVTTIEQYTNDCSSGLTYPQTMDIFLYNIKGCIDNKDWNAKTFLSFGGWAEGYTFNQQEIQNKDAYKASGKGPIKYVYPCFNRKNTLCESHPSSELIGQGQSWGYWCLKSEPNPDQNGKGQGAIACDGGTGYNPPQDCWPDFYGDFLKVFINEAISSNYYGIDIDYEPSGDVGNQPFNGKYFFNLSTMAQQKGLQVVHAPLNNFFFDNTNWDLVYNNYKSDTLKSDDTKTTTYRCEYGGYGDLLYSLYKHHNLDLQNIFIQFYNNPPGPCEVDGSDYCITSGNIGSIGESPGTYYTIGPACSGGASYNSGRLKDSKTKLLQCNYSDEKGNWAWQKDGYNYSGQPDQFPKMSGNYAGDPLGQYVKNDNKWLCTTREEDLLWSVESSSTSDGNTKITIGGIKNVISVMLLAKAYQPNATVSLGTVPPGGGNASNLSSRMIKDIYLYLIGLQNYIDLEIGTTKNQSRVLYSLMMNLYCNGRLQIIDNDDWDKYWGGPPGTSTFCSRYPGFGESNDKKLFGGLGAWSVYWTEITEGQTSISWIEQIKKDFHVNELTPEQLNSPECQPSSGELPYYCCYADPGTSAGSCYSKRCRDDDDCTPEGPGGRDPDSSFLCLQSCGGLCTDT